MGEPYKTLEIDGCNVDLYLEAIPGKSWKWAFVALPFRVRISTEDYAIAPVSGGIKFDLEDTLGWHTDSDRGEPPEDDVLVQEAKALIAWAKARKC